MMKQIALGQWLDYLLVTLIVVVSVLYAVYALSPASVKRRLLSWLVKVIGLRAFAWLAPNPGGCAGCESGAGQSGKLAAKLADQRKRTL